ncbi:hypothetical protein BHQ15_17570 [Mycolicibacillus koreensis]|nr:hypothetical protein BHQ15_17570 [Mycolicibacillus koreensis]
MRFSSVLLGGEPKKTETVDNSTAEETPLAVVKEEKGDAVDVAEATTEVDLSIRRYRLWPLRWSVGWPTVIAYAVLPGVVLLLALTVGFAKWQAISTGEAHRSGVAATEAATEATIALLSYQPDTVESDLDAARSRLTGTFLDSYTELTQEVVIPGAKQKQISAVATVPGAALVSVTGSHAVVLLFVNQTVIVGQDAPTDTASRVRVALDKVDDRWLISEFEPV